MTAPLWARRVLWLLGTIGRSVVLVGLAAGVFYWWEHGPGATDESSTGVIGPGVLLLGSFGALAAVWSFSEGVFNLSGRLMLWRWVTVTVIVNVFASLQLWTDGPPVSPLDALDLWMSWVFGLLGLGSFIIGGAVAGWTLGSSLRRPSLRPALVTNAAGRRQSGR